MTRYVEDRIFYGSGIGNQGNYSLCAGHDGSNSGKIASRRRKTTPTSVVVSAVPTVMLPSAHLQHVVVKALLAATKRLTLSMRMKKFWFSISVP